MPSKILLCKVIVIISSFFSIVCQIYQPSTKPKHGPEIILK